MHRLFEFIGRSTPHRLWRAQRGTVAEWQAVQSKVRKLFAVFRVRRDPASYGHEICSTALLGRDAALSHEPKIERLANNVRSATMKFVLVNDKAPRHPSRCGHCHALIGARYLRDLSSKFPYCGYTCYLARKIEAAPVVWYNGSGIDGLPMLGL